MAQNIAFATLIILIITTQHLFNWIIRKILKEEHIAETPMIFVVVIVAFVITYLSFFALIEITK